MNPYPVSWTDIGRLTYLTRIDLHREIETVQTRRGEDADYIVTKDYIVSVEVDGDPHQILVPAGFSTDISSTPKWLRWVVARIGTHTEASVIHDWLYDAWHVRRIGPTERDRLFADLVFLRAMEEARVGWLKRKIAYWGVRLGGRKIFYT